MIEYDLAYGEMCGLFQDAWTANAAAIVGYVPEVRWADVAETDIPNGDMFWCRHSVQTIDGEQTALGNCDQQLFLKRYTSAGLIFIQLFCPKSKNGIGKGRQLAKVARNAYRGKTTPGRIVFRNVRINDGLSPETQFLRINVIAEFEYDELG